MSHAIRSTSDKFINSNELTNEGDNKEKIVSNESVLNKKRCLIGTSEFFDGENICKVNRENIHTISQLIPLPVDCLQINKINVPFSGLKRIKKVSEEIIPGDPKFPTIAYGWLSDIQIEGLDFSMLSSEQIENCIRNGRNDKKTIQRRFSILSTQQLTIAVKTVQSNIWRFFPIECLEKLPTSEMTSQQIEELFWDSDIQEDESDRIKRASPEFINRILSNLAGDLLFKLSDIQIQKLDYTKIDKKQAVNIFLTKKTSRERKRTFSLVSPKCIEKLLEIIGVKLLPYLTEEHILSIDQEYINNYILNISFKKKEYREIAINLPSEIINAWIARGLFELFKFIPLAQISNINLENVPSTYLYALFPSIDPAKFFPGFTYAVKWELYNTLHKYKHPFLRGFELTTPAMIEILRKRKKICRDNYLSLAEGQFEIIKAKLTHEVVEFLECSN